MEKNGKSKDNYSNLLEIKSKTNSKPSVNISKAKKSANKSKSELSNKRDNEKVITDNKANKTNNKT